MLYLVEQLLEHLIQKLLEYQKEQVTPKVPLKRSLFLNPIH